MDSREAVQTMDKVEVAELAEEGHPAGLALHVSRHLYCPGCHRGRHQRWHPGTATAAAFEVLARSARRAAALCVGQR